MRLIFKILIFLLINLNVFADDIKEFKINEMSIGDSALKYYSKNQIKSSKQNWYKRKQYSTSARDGIQFSYKTKDSEYILAEISKTDVMDISQCLNELTPLADNISSLFSNKIKRKGPTITKHWADKSKKSLMHQYKFTFPNNDYIAVECYDWSKNVSWNDHLRVRIVTNKFDKFLRKQ